MSHLVERLTELRRHLDHLSEIRPRVTGPAELLRDLSLHNDVLFSLLMICQLVIDVAGELSARRGLRFEDYTVAVRNLASFEEFPETLVAELERFPGFRNVVVHEYLAVDMEQVVAALNRLEPVGEFVEIVARLERDQD